MRWMHSTISKTDGTHLLWPTLDVTPPPHCIVVNVCLEDVDANHGATKVWPVSGTFRIEPADALRDV